MAQKNMLLPMILLLVLCPVLCLGSELDLAGLINMQQQIETLEKNKVNQIMQNASNNSLQYKKAAEGIMQSATANAGCALECGAAKGSLLQDLEVKPTTTAVKSQAEIYVFVSLSMPTTSLLALLAEAKQFQATLILRGLKNNSYKQTAVALQEMIKRTGLGVVIDPETFKKYNIATVPTIVLAANNSFDKIAGNVSLEYALEQFVQHGDLSATAAKLLKRKP